MYVRVNGNAQVLVGGKQTLYHKPQEAPFARTLEYRRGRA